MLNALSAVEDIRKRLVAYALEQGYVCTPALREAIQHFYEGDHSQLVSELWLEAAWPYAASQDTLVTLSNQGVFSKSLLKLPEEQLSPGRLLYTHQQKAIRHEYEKRNDPVQPTMLITAGTGSGKTEAFLLPMLNRLVSRPRKGSGVRAIIIYPMNALIFDQVNRLDLLLKDNPLNLSFSDFTSHTPEDEKKANTDGVPRYGTYRRRTREDIRQSPPDILITNYSMLEYILARPKDSGLLDAALECIVLDEAHQYVGSMANEMAMMLRRICYAAKTPSGSVLHILTSATLGGNDTERIDFAAQFTSKPAARVNVITGEFADALSPFLSSTPAPIKQISTSERYDLKPTIKNDCLEEDEYESEQIRQELAFLVDGAAVPIKKHPAKQLYELLRRSPHVLWLAKYLVEKQANDESIVPLSDIPVDRDTLVWMLNLAASARLDINEKPLIPHRLHVMVSETYSLHVCLNIACTAPSDIKAHPFGGIFDGRSGCCPYCQHEETAEIRHCKDCGLPILVYNSDKDETRVAPEDWCKGIRPNRTISQSSLFGCLINESSTCPRCQSRGHIRPLYDRPITDTLVAETIMTHIPPISGYEHTLPAGGRRLLAFSDSRSKAAQLAPKLTKLHNTYLFKHWLLRFVKSGLNDDDREELADLLHMSKTGELKDYQKRKLELLNSLDNQAFGFQKLINASMNDTLCSQIFEPEWDKERMVIYENASSWGEPHYQVDRWQKHSDQTICELFCEEFHTAKPKANSLETLGFLEVVYPGIDKLAIPKDKSYVPDEFIDNYTSIITVLLDTLRMDEFYRCSLESNKLDKQLHHGGPQDWAIGEKDFVGTNENIRIRFVRRILDKWGWSCSLEEAKKHLRWIFRQLVDQSIDIPALHRENGTISVMLPKLALRQPKQLWYDELTGRVYTREFLYLLSDSFENDTDMDGPRSDFSRPISQKDADRLPRLSRLRSELQNESGPFAQGLWCEEHSAQIQIADASRIQQLFLRGARNLLSCTTTMELGVDIGGLNVVYNGNVPPVKASYLQRAGRAGRRADGSSLVITKIGSNPFDQQVLQDFKNYISTPMLVPKVDLQRDKIVRRHMNAVLYSEFFAKQETEWVWSTGALMGFDKPARENTSSDSSEAVSPIDRLITFITRDGQMVIENFRASNTQMANGSSVEVVDKAVTTLKTIRNEWTMVYKECVDSYNKTTGREQSFWFWQCKALWSEQVISILSEKQFLPRYGFPVDVRRLWHGSDKDHQPYKLERSATEALTEYAPGNQIPVSWQKVVSRGIMKSWMGDSIFGIQYRVKLEGGDVAGLEVRDNSLNEDRSYDSRLCLEPRFGFTTRRSAETRAIKKEDEYAVIRRFSLIPDGIPEFDSEGMLNFTFGEGLKVVALNMGRSSDPNDHYIGTYGYAVCTKCGHAQVEQCFDVDKMNLPRDFDKHYAIHSERYEYCWSSDEVKVMRNRVLIATMPTDIVFYEYPGLNQIMADTIGQALRLAGAKMLNVDFRQLMFLTYPARSGNGIGLAMFDNVAGGQSMVIDLHGKRKEWFDNAVKQLMLPKSPDHDKMCKKACIRCLITRDQSLTAFDRMAALGAFAEIRKKRPICSVSENERSEDGADGFGDAPPAPTKRPK